MRRTRSPCCAHAASGRATTAPPSTPRNARRFISNPMRRRRHRNDKDQHSGRGLEYSGTGHCAARPMSQLVMNSPKQYIRIESAAHLIAVVRTPERHSHFVPKHINGLMHRSEIYRYSITSSARASSVGGMSRPSALAVLRLITNSNLVDCTTGRSPGFSPLRIRPA